MRAVPSPHENWKERLLAGPAMNLSQPIGELKYLGRVKSASEQPLFPVFVGRRHGPHCQDVPLGVEKHQRRHAAGRGQFRQPSQGERFAFDPLGIAEPIDGNPQLRQGLLDDPVFAARPLDEQRAVGDAAAQPRNPRPLVRSDAARRPQVRGEDARLLDIEEFVHMRNTE